MFDFPEHWNKTLSTKIEQLNYYLAFAPLKWTEIMDGIGWIIPEMVKQPQHTSTMHRSNGHPNELFGSTPCVTLAPRCATGRPR